MQIKIIFRAALLVCALAFAAIAQTRANITAGSPTIQRPTVFVMVVEQMPWFGPAAWLPDSFAQPVLNCDGEIPFRQQEFKRPHHSFNCEFPDRPKLTRQFNPEWWVRNRVVEIFRQRTSFKLADSIPEADIVFWLQVVRLGSMDEKQRAGIKLDKVDRVMGAYALAVPASVYPQAEFDLPALRRAALWQGRAISGITGEAPLADLAQCFQQAMRKQAKPISKSAELTLKLDTNVVTVPVTVRDGAGRPVTGLARDDFRVAENGAAQDLALFNPVEDKFDIALILDASPSMRNRLDEVKRAAFAFVEKLRPQDRVMVISFDYRVCVEAEFTADREQIRRAINAVKIGTGSRVHDALDLTLTERLNKLDGRKAAVLFTDGVGGGQFAGEKTVMERVAAANTPVYVVLYDTHDEAARDLKARAPNTPSYDFQFLKESYEKAAGFLTDVARASGASLHRAEASAGLEMSFARIAEDLRNQYWLSYYPKDESRNVFNRVIQVAVNRPGFTVHSAKIRPDFPLALETDVSVGKITARPGEKVSGWIEAPELRNPDNSIKDAGTTIPISVIHGAQPGPTLALIAGNHGYEYTPIIALQRLLPHLDPKQMSGTVILVHVANMPSFLKRTIYYSPVDGKNLNRVYPGKAGGTISERIAYQITKEVIERADYVMDLHCGDGNEALGYYSYWDVKAGGPEVVEKSKQMALAFGFDHIVMDSERPTDPANSVYCSTTATTRGKPAITIESGGLGATDNEAITRIERGVMSVMRYLKIIPGKPEMVESPLFIDRSAVLRSEATGIFYPLVERNRTVAKGTLLGYVTDFFGARVFDLRAPFSGTVLYIINTPPISQGEPLAMIGHVAEAQR